MYCIAGDKCEMIAEATYNKLALTSGIGVRSRTGFSCLSAAKRSYGK